MQISGEEWEWIDPLLRRRLIRGLRRVVPQEMLIGSVNLVLRRALGILAKPYFGAVQEAAQIALGSGQMRRFLHDHLDFLLYFHLEMAKLVERSAQEIKRDLLPRLRMEVEPLREAMGQGRGVLLPTVHLNVPLRLLFTGLSQEGPIHMLLRGEQAGTKRLLDRADAGWRFIHLRSFPGRHLLRALHEGHAVLCNVDHAYPGTEVTLAPVLGHPAIVPSGVFRLALRNRTPVVPLLFQERDGEVSLVTPEILDWEPDWDGRLPVSRMLERVHAHLNRAVLETPEQWMGWGNLPHRWTAWRSHVRPAGLSL